MIEIKQVLKNFGLTSNEAEVYLLLIKIGNASASEIAQKTNIHRINIYDLLERLQRRGLVSFVIVGKRKHYEAVHPKKIIEIEEERKKEIESIIPELIKQTQGGKLYQEVTVFKDKKGIKNVIDELTNIKSFDFFASGWGFANYFGKEYSDIWHEKLNLNKVEVRCLISRKFKQKLQMPEALSYRYLPSEFDFPSTSIIFEDKILILLWSSSPLAILIRSKEINKSYKNFFEILWKISKKQ